jgi:hypothetical protein
MPCIRTIVPGMYIKSPLYTWEAVHSCLVLAMLPLLQAELHRLLGGNILFFVF